VRKSAFRFVLERAVRRALRPAEDGSVVDVFWAVTPAVGEEEEEEAGLAFVAPEAPTFAFRALARDAIGAGVVVGRA
jgi:hypothetical protein